MPRRVSKNYSLLPPGFLTVEHRDDGIVLSLLGEIKLRERIRQQSPILLGDIVFILPRDSDKYSFNEGFVVQVREKQVYVKMRLGLIRRKRENLWAITYSEGGTQFQRNHFPLGFEPPEDYVTPPPREGVDEIYYNRLVDAISRSK